MVFKPGTGFAFSNYVANAKKLNPFQVHSTRLFIPHVGSFHSPTWGYQKHNSYRVAMPHNAFIMQYSANRKTIFRLFIPHIGSFYSPTWSFQRHDSYRVAMPHNAFVMQYSTNCKTIFLRYEGAKAVSGSFYTLIYSPRSSFHSPTWGYQKHNSYWVAMLYSAICNVI